MEEGGGRRDEYASKSIGARLVQATASANLESSWGEHHFLVALVSR